MEMLLVTFFINSTSIVLIAGVLVLYSRVKRHDVMERKLFFAMSAMLMLLAGSFMFEEAFSLHVIRIPRLVATLEGSFHDTYINTFCFLWILYINYRMYGSLEYAGRRKWIYLTPYLIIIALDIINIFYPILFYYDDNLAVHNYLIFRIEDVVRYGYVLVSVYQLHLHRRKGNDVRFFQLSAFLVPALLGAVTHDLTGYKTLTFGFAISLTLLYAGIANEFAYGDRETGFFNGYYLGYFRELINSGKYDLGSAMIFDLGSRDRACDFVKLLKKQLPIDCEPVRFSPGKFVVFSKVTERSPLHMVTEDVKLAVEEWNEKNSDKTIAVECAYYIRKKKESPKELLERIVEKQVKKYGNM